MTAADLSPAERELLQQMLTGKRMHELAAQRGALLTTVKNQCNRLRIKLGLRTLMQVGAWCERHGIREAQA